MDFNILDYNIYFDIAAVILYLLLIMLYSNKPHIKDQTHRIYQALFGCATMAPIFDVMSTIGITYQMHGVFVVSSTMLFYLALEGITFFFLTYIVMQLDQYKKMSVPKQLLLRVPVILVTLLIFSNDFTGVIFSYGADRIYSVGPLQWVTYAVACGYFLWAVAYVIIHRKGYDKLFCYTVYNICVVNLIFIVVQLIFPKILIICFGFAVSMILLYLTAHTKNSSIDRETGMLNRYYLSEATAKMIYGESSFSLIMVRIADYTMLSGTYGIMNVERLVKDVARMLGTYVNTGDAFQTSNSAFALIVHDPKQAEEIVHEIDAELNREWHVDDQIISFAYLITSLDYPNKIKDIEQLLAYLTYFEKMKKMRYGIIPSDEIEIRDTAREALLEKVIRRGLDNHNLRVYYQPICVAKTQEFVTAEALVRLIDPELGFISPAEFIPVAEHSGLMIPVGNYVLDEVCRFIGTHDMEKLGLKYIEVNLSVVQCLQRDFMDIVHDTLKRHNVEPKYLCFEITETASNCAPEIFTSNLKMLVEEGFCLAMDDFGSGYGNLQRMVTSNFHIVKFDKDITTQTCAAENLRKAFKRMVPLFHSLDLMVVSEGVETQEQYEYLVSVGVNYIQGYYFSKPVPEADFIAFIEAHLSDTN